VEANNGNGPAETADLVLLKVFRICRKAYNGLPQGESPSEPYYKFIENAARRYWGSRDIESSIDLLMQAGGVVKYNFGRSTVTKYPVGDEDFVRKLHRSLDMPYPKVMEFIGICKDEAPGKAGQEGREPIKNPETRTVQELIFSRTGDGVRNKLQAVQQRYERMRAYRSSGGSAENRSEKTEEAKV
jgi:hypothetical protein